MVVNISIENPNKFKSTHCTSDSIDQVEEYLGAHSFRAHELLGSGSFGEVYLVEKISDLSFHAMKVLNKDKIIQNRLTRYAMTERNVLSNIKHPFIVSLNFAF